MATTEPQHITDPDVMQCPFGYYATLHGTDAPTHEEAGIGTFAHRYADIMRIATDSAHFSSMFGGTGHMMGVAPDPYSPEVQALVDQFEPMAPNALLLSDPPIHTRHRSLFSKALNGQRIREMEPKIRALADELIDDFIDDGHCEFVTQFAIRLPITIITDALGVDRKHMGDFKRWSDHFIAGLISVLDNEQRVGVAQSILEFQAYIKPRIAERRAEPQDDLLSAIVHAEMELDEDGASTGPRRLTDPEVYAFIAQILVGGNRTTTDHLGSAMVLLCQHPDTMAALQADASLIPGFVEEVLRYDSPAQCMWRIGKEGADVGGTPIPAGGMVSVMLGAANRDPSVFPDPDTFDIRRPNARKHLTFNHGPHFCVGAELARNESRIAYETLLSRLTDIKLADPDGLHRRDDFATNGWERIELRFSKA